MPQDALESEARRGQSGFWTKPLSPHIGLEILGVDLEQDLDDHVRQQIVDAWTQSGVLLFRGGGTSVDAHMRLSECFGELQPSANKELNLDGNPYLMELAYDPKSPRAWNATRYEVGGETRCGWLGWHWDQAFMPTIIRGAVLRMIDVPEVAGETGFLDAIGAYDRLPEQLRRRIENLEVVYDYTPSMEENRFGFPKDLRVAHRQDGLKHEEFSASVHPLVITQLETGRKVLKLSPMHSKYVLGLDRAESDALLEELASYLVDERYAYFHDWGEGDLIVWDNWRVIHCANGVPPECTRRVQRTTIIGDYGNGRYLDESLGTEIIGAVIYD